MTELCELTGAGAQQLALGLGHDHRIGSRHAARPGFGGGCLPKELAGFTHRAEELGADRTVAFLRQVDAVNQRRRERTIQLAQEMLGGELPQRSAHECRYGAPARLCGGGSAAAYSSAIAHWFVCVGRVRHRLAGGSSDGANSHLPQGWAR